MNKQVKERLAAAQAKVDEAKKAVANQTPDENSGVATPPEVTKPSDSVESTESQSEVVTPPKVDEAKKAEKPKGKSEKNFVVVSPFRDASDFNKTWSIGQDVSHFTKERLEKCINLKLVEQK